jgi:hypothetical protein
MHKLGLRIHRKRTRGLDLCLLIDGTPLVDRLEAAANPGGEKVRWTERDDARVQTKELKRSVRREGEFDFLTCAHCDLPEDLDLGPFAVTHEGAHIVWQVTPPGEPDRAPGVPPLRFRFDRVQYAAAVRAILQREECGGA